MHAVVRNLGIVSCVLTVGLLVGSSSQAPSAAAVAAEPETQASANVHRRGSLDNCRIEFTTKKRGHVAFLGGSITEMEGYRPLVIADLQKRFPDTQFTFTSAGISSTCSTTGAFRLVDDVLAQGPVDLFFVEFAVNDDQDAMHARRECIRGMEGIIRHIRAHNPAADIVVTHFVNEGMLKTIDAGQVPLTVRAHEDVAQHYDVSTIDLANEVAGQIKAGTLTWQKYGGVHPAPFGNALCAQLIALLLEGAHKAPLAATATKQPHPLPEKPLDAGNYQYGRFLDVKQAELGDGWTLAVPAWAKLKGQCRTRFKDLTMLSTTEPGQELTLKFTGTAIGAYVLAGPDAGIAEASVDGGPFEKVQLYHQYSSGLHYPRTVMFQADLPAGTHTLKLRTSRDKHPNSSGTAMRIVKFAVNAQP